MSEISTIKNEILHFAKRYRYFSIVSLKKHLSSEEISFSDNTVKKYLSDLQNSKQLYSAGLGWYSTIEEKFELNTAPIKSLVDEVSEQFPLLDFSIWSTEQIRGYFHHLPGTHYTFFYTDADYLHDVYSVLLNAHQFIYLNPTPKESQKFITAKKAALIIRPAITEEPTDEYFATIEKLLVDLYLEKGRAFFIDETEYDAIFQNILTAGRINIAKMLRYSRRRKSSGIKGKINILAAP